MILARKNKASTRTADTGFTLIEILIVIVIASIMATLATLSINAYVNARQVQSVADELNLKMTLAERQALLQPAVIGLVIQPHAYEFYQFVTLPHQQTGHWQKISGNRLFVTKTLSNYVVLQVKSTVVEKNTDKDIKTLQPQIMFLPTGEITAFVLDIGKNGKKATYRIEGDETGAIRLITLKP